MTARRRFVNFYDMVNREGIFPGIHRTHPHFCLLTLSGGQLKGDAVFSFYNTNTSHLADERRRFTLLPEDIALINPNTRTCPIFRSQADAELTKKIYRRVPVLIDESKGPAGNPWAIRFLAMFHMANDSALFRTNTQLDAAGRKMTALVSTLPNGVEYVPLYEGKMIWQFDHRYSGHDTRGSERGNRVLPKTTLKNYQDSRYAPLSYYWVPKSEIDERLWRWWKRKWFIGWKDVTTSVTERTLVASALPRVGCGDILLVMLPSLENTACIAALLGNLNSLPEDYIARQKVGGVHLKYVTMKQLPVLPPSGYTDRDLAFIVPRVVELTYTAWDMQPFARDLGFDREPYPWDPERRAELRAELDAYYAYLYGLSKEELRYILDPKDVMGEDYPSETFRVLKDNEIRKYGEYRTRRLVLEAYDRFATDGTFDPARLEDPEYFPVVRRALEASKAREQELEKTLEELVARAEQTSLPTLFVEGATDARIIEAAWRALFPGEPVPFAVLAAGGTMQMKSLAAPGRAMRELLGDRLVMALADNDAEGRELWNEGNLHKGGVWKPQTNGVHWCLLKPSDEFTAVMERFQVPRTHWPFTIENAFSAALRREAMAEGAYAVSDKATSSAIPSWRSGFSSHCAASTRRTTRTSTSWPPHPRPRTPSPAASPPPRA